MATIRGTDGDDVLQGLDGPRDFLGYYTSGVGDDLIFGAGGDDVLRGSGGNDSLYGEAGDDALHGDGGADRLVGGDGDDRLDGGDDADTLLGGAGRDVLSGGGGDDRLLGGDGPDLLHGGQGYDLLSGGDGDDRLDLGPDQGWSPGGTEALGGDGLDTLARGVPVRATTFFAPGAWDRDGGRPGRSAGIEVFEFTDGRFTQDRGDAAAQVHRLYRTALGRAPDPDGLSQQVALLVDGAPGRPGGAPLAAVAQDLLGSAEALARHGAGDDAAFVARLYRDALGREADAAGQAHWTARAGLAGRAEVLVGLSESAECVALTGSAVDGGLWVSDREAARVLRLYDAILGRRPDAAGLAYWDDLLEAGAATPRGVAGALLGSDEFLRRRGYLDDRAFVEVLYAQALDRAADAAGADHWQAQIAAVGRAGVAAGLSESAEHAALTARFQTATGFELG